jgi:hypothetical protein
VQALPASGAGVSLINEDGVRGVAAASDPTSSLLEELQFTLGEGPAIDAFTTRRPVLESAVGNGATARWPGFSPVAHGRGVRAVFAFPLQVGAARLGVLDVYNRTAGPLSAAVIAQALTFAEVAVETLLDGQARAVLGDAAEGLDAALEYRYVIYQAQGMVMVDLGIPLGDAMARLRAFAYAHDRPLTQVSAEIVAGRLRLHSDLDA